MTLFMVALGLRVGEVTELHLDDIDWRAGTVRIKSAKNRRTRLPPLPNRVGKATARYLHGGRPSSTQRQVFLRHSVPVGIPGEPGTCTRGGPSCLCACRLSTRVDGNAQSPSHGGDPVVAAARRESQRDRRFARASVHRHIHHLQQGEYFGVGGGRHAVAGGAVSEEPPAWLRWPSSIWTTGAQAGLRQRQLHLPISDNYTYP